METVRMKLLLHHKLRAFSPHEQDFWQFAAVLVVRAPQVWRLSRTNKGVGLQSSLDAISQGIKPAGLQIFAYNAQEYVESLTCNNA
jgi:hypothetical protein